METDFMHEQVEHNPEFNKWWQEWLCAIEKRRGELPSVPNSPTCSPAAREIAYPETLPRTERVM